MARRVVYTKPKASLEETLLDYLVTRFTYRNAEQWRHHIACGHVSLNGNADIMGDEVLQQRDVVVFAPPRSLEPRVDEVNIRLLYEDSSVLVCVKNGDLPVAEGGRYCQNTLIGVLHRRQGSWGPSGATLVENASVEHSESGAKRYRVEAKVDGDSTAHVAPVPAGAQRLAEGQLRFFTVHRLDKETSGIVVVAKSSAVANEQRAVFEAHAAALTREVEGGYADMSAEVFSRLQAAAGSAQKSYIALMAGAVPTLLDRVVVTRVGTVAEHPLSRELPEHQRLKKLKMICEPEIDSASDTFGKRACSRIRVLATSERLGISLARVDILTGRSHQIRLHCAHIGFPVLGDKLYTTTSQQKTGGCVPVADDVYLERVRRTDPGSDGPAFISDALVPKWKCRRHLLHAAELSFPKPGHPAEVLRFRESPLEWFMRDLTFDGDGSAGEISADSALDEVRAMLTSQWPLL